MSTPSFEYTDPDLGHFCLAPFAIDTHCEILQQWVNQSHAGFWGMQGHSLEQVRAEQTRLMASGTQMFIGSHRGQPQFFIEVYKPADSELIDHISLRPHDLGMHILIAKPDTPQSGFSLAVFHCVMRFLFEAMGAERVLVEPDAANRKVHALNRQVGFWHFAQVKLQAANKHALLASCEKADYYQRSAAIRQPPPPSQGCTAEAWQWANRQMVAKALSEFSHERLLQPQAQDKEHFTLTPSQGGHSYYRFRAQRLPLDHWLVDADSIERLASEGPRALMAVEFIQEFQHELGIDDALLPTYLEEIASTLNSQAWKYQHPIASSQKLVDADFQTLEQAMIEGHPCFIANSGRIGFDGDDIARYSPEAGQAVSLLWIAVHRRRSSFHAVAGLDYQGHINDQLDLSLRLDFAEQLRQRGLDEDDYWLMPVHPWQWQRQLQRLFAGELADQHIVFLGSGGDIYQAQQSIRTFYNRSRPHQPYVKVALSILNMGFMRGLSSKYMAVTPAINEWVADTFAQDPFLRSQPIKILREYAAMGYRHPQFDRGPMQGSAYNKMLAALWRDNPVAELKPQQKAMTMAALLHVDKAGTALLPLLIARSGLTTEQWLEQYFQLYFVPLLHCFYQHHMVFMPHGENLILVMENNVPVAAYLKDIGEEVCLLNSNQELPQAVARIHAKVPKEVELLSIFTDIFDCFFRQLSALLYRHSGFSYEHFWQTVARVAKSYQHSQPHLRQRFAEHDLFAEHFALSCLNRLQLRNNKQMVDLLNPADALQFAGELSNPIARCGQNSQQATTTQRGHAAHTDPA